MDAVQDLLYRLSLFIDNLIYSFVGFLYEIFMWLARAEIFNATRFDEILQRVYMIIGVVMLFVVIYSLMRALVNPDDLTKGDTSTAKIAMNIVISIVIITIVPTIFSLMYRIQNAIIEENVLQKIILGNESEVVTYEELVLQSNSGESYKVFEGGSYNKSDEAVVLGANQMASTMFGAFFYATDTKTGNSGVSVPENKVIISNAKLQSELNCKKTVLDYVLFKKCNDWMNQLSAAEKQRIGENIETNSDAEITLEEAFSMTAAAGDFEILYPFIDRVISGEVTYKWFFSTAAGLFMVYVILSFCIDLGLRAIKLAFYQLIAPVTVLSRIIPGQKKIFESWTKATLKTFLDVFIRIIIITFGIYVISLVPEIVSGIFTSPSSNWLVSTGVKIMLIFGILMFMKQAPKLISEVFGFDSGSLQLGIKNKMKDLPLTKNRFIGAATGALGGGVVSMRQGTGFGAGATYGALNGWKDKGLQFGNQKDEYLRKMTGNYKAKAGLLGGEKTFMYKSTKAAEKKLTERYDEVSKAKSDKQIEKVEAKYENDLQDVRALKNRMDFAQAEWQNYYNSNPEYQKGFNQIFRESGLDDPSLKPGERTALMEKYMRTPEAQQKARLQVFKSGGNQELKAAMDAFDNYHSSTRNYANLVSDKKDIISAYEKALKDAQDIATRAAKGRGEREAMEKSLEGFQIAAEKAGAKNNQDLMKLFEEANKSAAPATDSSSSSGSSSSDGGSTSSGGSSDSSGGDS